MNATLRSSRESRIGMLEKPREFFKEFRIEMKKVSWPSRKEVVASTGVVLLVVLFISLYLGMADFVFSKLLRFMLS
jgi:preprotein translocase subunit SecE